MNDAPQDKQQIDVDVIRDIHKVNMGIATAIRDRALLLNKRYRCPEKNPEGEPEVAAPDFGVELRASLEELGAILREANQALAAFIG